MRVGVVEYENLIFAASGSNGAPRLFHERLVLALRTIETEISKSVMLSSLSFLILDETTQMGHCSCSSQHPHGPNNSLLHA